MIERTIQALRAALAKESLAGFDIAGSAAMSTAAKVGKPQIGKVRR